MGNQFQARWQFRDRRPAPPACVADNSKRRSRPARSGNEMASFGAGGGAEGAPAGTQRERKGSAVSPARPGWPLTCTLVETMSAPDRLGGPSGQREAPRLGKIAQAREQPTQNQENKITSARPAQRSRPGVPSFMLCST